MKKRVLSFLLACFMVVSTFIISKPLVHVHAVEGEQTFVEGENQWTLPENFRPDTLSTFDENGWPINGQWRLRSYAYVNSTQANFASVLKLGTTGSTAPAWWINPTGQTQSEQFSSNGTNPGMRVNPFNSAAAIVCRRCGAVRHDFVLLLLSGRGTAGRQPHCQYFVGSRACGFYVYLGADSGRTADFFGFRRLYSDFVNDSDYCFG